MQILKMNRPTKLRLGVAAAAVSMVALTACSGGGSDSEAPAKRVGVSTFGKGGGGLDTLNWGLPYGEPNTIDPPNTAYYSSAFVAANLCDPLLKVDADFAVKPNLASAEQVDDKTVVFTLKPDVKFWDGTTMTADDVVWSLRHAADPKSVVGFLFGSVKSIEKTGPLEVTVNFKNPDSLFLQEMGSFSGMVQQKAFSEAAGSKLGSAEGGLMCTGAFKLDKWTPGSKIELSANPDYWDTEGKPHAKKANLTFTTDSTSLAQALVSGQLDGAYEVPASAIPRLEKAKSAGNLVFGAPSQLYLSASNLQTTGPLASKDLRKALWMSINRKAIADVAYHGAAEPNYTLANKDSWDNKAMPEEARAIWADAYKVFEKERGTWGSASAVTEAKKLVDSSGYDGTPVVFATLAGDQTLSQVAQLIQAQAKQVGITVEIKPLQAIDYSNATVDPKNRVGIDVLLSKSFNVAPDPQETVNFSVLPDSFYNYTGYENADVTRLLTKALATFDPVERAKLGTEAQAIYEAAYNSQVLVQMNEVVFLRKGLGGATTSFAYMNLPSLALIGEDE